MARYIDADKLKERIRQEPTDGMFTNEILDAIDEQPDEDVPPERHGKWKFESPYDGIAHCTRCDYRIVAYEFPENTSLTVQQLREIFRNVYCYCPKCGAKMDGKNKKGDNNK